MVRNSSHKKWWTPTNKVTYNKEEKEDYKIKRELLKTRLYSEFAINIGNPGDMVTGRAFQIFASDAVRNFICSVFDVHDSSKLGEILLGLCATVKVINSQKRKINVEKLRLLTQDVYLNIVRQFPWASISPSVHRILAHSWEVIQLNEGFGLGNISEEGQEALNKYIRQFRSRGARKDATLHNFTDTFNHMWDRSRRKIIHLDRDINRRKQRILVSSEIESLVNSLFVEEDVEME